MPGVATRFIQGLGAGAVMALAIMNLRFALPQHLVEPIIGINAITITIAAAAGPGIAGHKVVPLIDALANWWEAIKTPMPECYESDAIGFRPPSGTWPLSDLCGHAALGEFQAISHRVGIVSARESSMISSL